MILSTLFGRALRGLHEELPVTPSAYNRCIIKSFYLINPILKTVVLRYGYATFMHCSINIHLRVRVRVRVRPARNNRLF